MKMRLTHWLLLLGLVPVAAGGVRLAGLAEVAGLGPAEPRFAQAPWAIVVHIVCASLYCVLGAFQFDHRLRQRHVQWHRLLGRVALPCGLLAALSGVWMALYTPIPLPLQGELLRAVRMMVGGAMTTCLVGGVAAVLGGDLRGHQAWMMRAYALGQGAGTQVLLLLPAALVTGAPVTGWPRDLLMAGAWLINLAVVAAVEAVLRARTATVRQAVAS